jgi:hypothetical protein
VTTVDDFLLRHAPRPPQPVERHILDARGALNDALATLAAIADGSLERPWPWRDIEVDIRYGFYRQYEALEDARAHISRNLPAGRSPAQPLAGAATAARWDLHGLLAGLSDEMLDADPGGGEWTIRQTLGHIVGGQRAYSWFTAWWLAQHGLPADDFPTQVPDELSALLPDETVEAEGTMGDIRRRLDEIVDLSAGVLGGLSDEEFSADARWAGQLVTVGFRIGRWSSHVREHTIQVEKTLVMLDRVPNEVARLVRLIAAAYGRAEAEVFMLPADEPAGAEALEVLVATAASIKRDAAAISASA